MTFANPAFQITRQSVVGMEGEWVKMFDPPTASPPTPELVAPTNPVPEVMAAAGFQLLPAPLHTVHRHLMRTNIIPTWDGVKALRFFVIGDDDSLDPGVSGGAYPGPTIRIPRGAIFHGRSVGAGPPPHTIHWHGLEPTPINDGVGHCSMEIGDYTYQFQPNFIGTYFYHCHRNTVQHFEFGLFGAFLVEPPDAYFASIASTNANGSVVLNPAIPIGACRDGKFRTAANLAKFPQFPGFNSNPLTAPDPLGQFATDPHAMTVPYDVEALWVPDDRDSIWSDLAPNARTTFPRMGATPGVDDNFQENPGVNGFFAFNQFNSDYFFITGLPVPAPLRGTGTIQAGVSIPPALNSGKSGTQVSVNARVGQTILVRCLDAAYNDASFTFPVDVVVIAFDGRALGVPPATQYSEAFLVRGKDPVNPAGTPIHVSVARRFDMLIRPTQPINDFATVDFLDTRQGDNSSGGARITARIPFVITEALAGAVFTISGFVFDEAGAPVSGVTMTLTGAASQTTVTNAAGAFTLAGLLNGNYTITPSFVGTTFTQPERTLSINGADVTAQDFVVQSTFAISGVVASQSGAPLSGVVMNLTGPTSKTITTDNTGNYSLTGLPNGDYTLAPSLAGFVFTPASANVTINLANVTGRNFAAAPSPLFGISGAVTGPGGAPLAGVTITLTGPANRTLVTDGSGNYSVSGLADGNYVVTPSLAGFAFSPPSTSISLSGSNITGRDFAAARITISGTVTGQVGEPLAGVAMSLAGPTNRTALTDASGNYSMTGLANGNYTLTPSLAGFDFTPASLSLSVSGASLTGRNFTAATSPLFGISGAVIDLAGANIAGVTMALTGAANRTVVTDASGNYNMTGLASGNYTVTPSLAGFTFTPPSANLAISGATVPGVNFVASQPNIIFSLSGRVTNQSGGPLGGVTIALTGAASGSVLTDAAGNYSLAGLPNGTYTLRPSLVGIPFTPASMEVALSGTNLTGMNFVGTLPGLGFRQEIFLPLIVKGPVEF